jgi:hypothetical protein
MGETVVDVSPSVDGYVAGAGVSVEQPFGSAGLRLHRWLGFDGASPSAGDEERADDPGVPGRRSRQRDPAACGTCPITYRVGRS